MITLNPDSPWEDNLSIALETMTDQKTAAILRKNLSIILQIAHGNTSSARQPIIDSFISLINERTKDDQD